LTVLTIEPVFNETVFFDPDGDGFQIGDGERAVTDADGRINTVFEITDPDAGQFLTGFPDPDSALSLFLIEDYGLYGAATDSIISPIGSVQFRGDVSDDLIAAAFGISEVLDFGNANYLALAQGGSLAGAETLESNGVVAILVSSMQALQLQQLGFTSAEEALENATVFLADYIKTVGANRVLDFTQASEVETLQFFDRRSSRGLS
jgi:hypothetical protein